MHRRALVPPLVAFALLAVLAVIAHHIIDVLIPFILSFALAYLLNPVVKYFEARGLRRIYIVVAIYLFVAAAVMAAANSLIPTVSTELRLMQAKAPAYFKTTHEMMARYQHHLAMHIPFGQTVVESWSLKLYDPLVEQLPKLPTYVLGLFPLFSLLFLVPFITFFLLLDSKLFLQQVIQICPSRYVEQTLHLLSEIDTSLGNYIRGILIVVLAIAVASYIGLALLGVDYALAIATLSGAASFIPYLGAILGMAVGALVAFFQFHNFWVPLQVVFLFLGIRLGDEAFLQPVIAKHSVHLHPLVFLLSLMVGGKIFGFIGLLFAVPAACVIKSLILVGWDWYVSETQVAPRPAFPAVRFPYT